MEIKTFIGENVGYITGILRRQVELDRYLTLGGYPEFLNETDYSFISHAIRDKIKLIFFKDIIRYFRVRNPTVFEDLFKILAKSSGDYFNLADTAHLLNIERPTLRNYLNYLTKAYLIKPSEFYSESRRKRIRKQDKIYVLDPGIRNAVVDFLDEDDLRYHETPTFWAHDIYYGADSYWWNNPPNLKPKPFP